MIKCLGKMACSEEVNNSTEVLKLAEKTETHRDYSQNLPYINEKPAFKKYEGNKSVFAEEFEDAIILS